MAKLARALAVLAGVSILLYAIDLALLAWWTSDPMIVRLDVTAPPAATADVPVDDPASLGDQSAAQEQLYQARAYAGLTTWAGATTVLAALVMLAWYALVFLRERRTFGPASQASAFVWWIVLILLYLVAAIGLYFWLITPMELVRYINDLDFYLLVGVVGLLGAIAVWIASLFGIGPVLRPSVPLGVRFS